MSDPTLATAEAAARAAGALLLERYVAGGAGAILTKSTATDPVSEADLAAEAAIRAVLAERAPDDGVRGEEGDDVPGSSGRWWTVDPLDGTVNYLYGNPQWSVSVACDGVAGVVYDPVRDELFSVGPDGPPAVNGAPLTASTCDDLAHTLLGTGFGYASATRTEQAAVVARVLPRVRDIRRAGSAALDLAWTAAGRLDAFYERGVKWWDIAAGSLMCERAGLVVTTLPERGPDVPQGIAVSPPAIHDELLELISGSGAAR